MVGKPSLALLVSALVVSHLAQRAYGRDVAAVAITCGGFGWTDLPKGVTIGLVFHPARVDRYDSKKATKQLDDRAWRCQPAVELYSAHRAVDAQM